MIKFVFKPACVLAAAVALNGCSTLFGEEGYFRDRGDDYLKADAIPPMNIPAELDQGPMDQLYTVPASASNADYEYPEEFEVPRPQALATNQLEEKVKIQRLGANRWILINTPPSEVWPRIRSFLSRTGLQVAFTDATNGIIETTWLQFKTDLDNKDRYRLRIEQGVQPDSTEVHVLHMSVAKELTAQKAGVWPKSSNNAERESWMIDELAANLASEVSSGATSLLAQTIGGSAKVELSNGGGEPLLFMDLDYTRAWATLGYAVQREGFSLWDEDKQAGVFYIDYTELTDEDDEPGFFSRLFSSEDDQQAGSPYSLQQILDSLNLEDNEANRHLLEKLKPFSGGAPLDAVPGYLVFINEADNRIEVRVRDGYAGLLSPKESKKLLKEIRRNLI